MAKLSLQGSAYLVVVLNNMKQKADDEDTTIPEGLHGVLPEVFSGSPFGFLITSFIFS